MRKVMKMVAIVASICMMSFSVYATEISWDDVPGNHENSVLLQNDLNSKDEYRTVARGDFLSGGAVDITNGQNGTIIIGIDTYAHRDVDRIFHTVFLDQWDEDEQDWIQLEHWNFVKAKEEVADGRLSMLLTSFTVTGCETNKYYRLRGLHGVEYNDEVEACATETDGIKITDGPT